jgi:hypothetical protein
MDKQALKAVIPTFTPGSQVSLVFLGEYAARSGTYTLERHKVGRGKGGSLVMVLRGADGSVLETGTSQSDHILNVTGPDGVRHGHETATEVPRKFETNKDLAKGLKEQMNVVVGFPGSRVRVTSAEPEFSGDFEVVDGSRLKGRYGQVRLALRNIETDTTVELWSYRHSGVVSGFEVLERMGRTFATATPTPDDSDTSEA